MIPPLHLLFVVQLLSGNDVNMVCINKYILTQYDISYSRQLNNTR